MCEARTNLPDREVLHRAWDGGDQEADQRHRRLEPHSLHSQSRSLYPCRSAKLGVTDSTYFEVYGDQMNSVSTRHVARSHQSVLTGSRDCGILISG